MALNGITFDKQTVKALDDGIFHKTLAGKDGILYGMGITYSGLNVTIAPGYFIAAGCIVQNDANLTLPISASGNTYARLRFKADLSIAASATTFTQGAFIWDVNASGTFVALTQNDIYNGGNVYEIEFCVVQITSSVVVGVTRQLSKIRSTNTRVVLATLGSGSWSGSAAPYTQTVSVPGIVPDIDIVDFDLTDDATSAQITAAQAAGPVRGQITGAGVLTITARGDKPAIDLPIKIRIAG